MNLENFGWNESFENHYKNYKEQGYLVGRVYIEHKHIYRIYTVYGEMLAEISGKMRFNAVGYQDYPAVGDWVVVSVRPEEKRATIHAVLPRKSKFSRKVAGTETEEQVVAANFDTVFIVTSLNMNFNVRRIERYLIMAWESGAMPVIILSKADLCENVDEMISQIEAVAIGVPIHVISSLTGKGMDEVRKYIEVGKTITVLGSSGVGKSTLINHLAGEKILEVQEVREDDDEGRHTTTHRQLVLLPTGGLVIDTPGMRELQLWDGGDGIHEAFDDVEAVARNCRFNDCKHENEPGCAVRLAVEDGSLSNERLVSYKKLQRELRYLETKQNQLARLNEKKKWKGISKALRR